MADHIPHEPASVGARVGVATSEALSEMTKHLVARAMTPEDHKNLARLMKDDPEEGRSVIVGAAYGVARELRGNVVIQILAPIVAHILSEHDYYKEACGEECADNMMTELLAELLEPIIIQGRSLYLNKKNKDVASVLSSDPDPADMDLSEVNAKLAELMASVGKNK